ncbi:MAG: hypothetical protein ACJAZO_002868 [Myxococcota bacterium]|jgi:hypothetical protein
MFTRTFVLWLALAGSSIALAEKPPLSEQSAMQLFFDSGYTSCDARLLKEAWSLQMEYGAKVRTGRFLDQPRGRNRVSRYVAEQRLASGQSGNRCSTWEIGLEPYQIDALAAIWGTSTMDTKSRVETEFAANRWRGIRDKIDFHAGFEKLGYYDKTGAGQADYGNGTPEFRGLDQTPFTYCDAERVAQVWGVSTDAAVTRLNEKSQVLSKPDLVASMEAVRTVTPTHTCDFYPDFSYDDASRLAGSWGLDLMESKAQLGTKLTGGYATHLMRDYGYRTELAIPDVSGGASHFFADLHPAAFDARGFTACDARMLARLWSVSNDDAVERAGRKLLDPGQYGALDTHRADSHRLATADGFECAFGDSFTPEQLTTMATYWSLGEDDARARAVHKLMHGDSQEFLREALTWQ